MPNPDKAFLPDRIFSTLLAHDVEFIVIGGLAAEAHGAGWTTFDADIVIATSEDNFVRLAAALTDLEAIYYLPDRRRIVPDLRRIRSVPGPQLLTTKHGRLDVLKEAGGLSYEALMADAYELRDGDQVMWFASVRSLLTMKRAANRPKDREGIARLEAALGSGQDPDEN